MLTRIAGLLGLSAIAPMLLRKVPSCRFVFVDGWILRADDFERLDRP
ncbi:MAG: hypothetical protein H6851_09440 [Geminicoccaceae bacterium]|nr:hypothetical protein [Geminicoccaceae bacterium]